MTRKSFLRRAGAGLAVAAVAPWHISRAAEAQRPYLTPPTKIEAAVKKARPLSGGAIPKNLAERLGATHFDGRYSLTTKPYLIEGAEALHRLGMGVAKFWLTDRSLGGYGYNSSWGVEKGTPLAKVLQHPYYRQALAIPFKTVAFEIYPIAGGDFPSLTSDYAEDEQQLHDIAAHLLAAYGDRDITFILQHWEGDWMLRGKAGGNWEGISNDLIRKRCESFARWLAARQRGVERARKAAPQSRCKVYHAAEVNRVWDGQAGIPTVTTHVLPQVAVDLVSWSSYDGMSSATQTWQGIELIRHHMLPSPAFGNKAVYIGEVGKPEQESDEKSVVDWWDRALGVFLAMDLPWIIHWQLYCNEPKDKKRWDFRQRKTDEMRGFWLIRPDGSLAWSANYLAKLLAAAGGTLPKT